MSPVTTIDVPGGALTVALGINNDGSIVGQYADDAGTRHGFLFANGTFTTVDDPLGVKGSAATGINKEGAIVGDYLDASRIFHGFESALSDSGNAGQ